MESSQRGLLRAETLLPASKWHYTRNVVSTQSSPYGSNSNPFLTLTSRRARQDLESWTSLAEEIDVSSHQHIYLHFSC